MPNQPNEKTAEDTLRQMKCEPDDFFKHPNEVFNLQGASTEDKKIILSNWLDYLGHLSDSEEEGMRGSESPAVTIQEIRQTLDRLQ